MQDEEDITKLLFEEDSCLFEDDKSQLTDKQTALLKLYTFSLLMFQSVFPVSDNAINVLFSILFFNFWYYRHDF